MERKIYRSRTDYIFTGVCGGIAEYFDIDATLVRLIFIVLTLGGGSGAIIYIILTIIIPRENGKTVAIDRKEKVHELVDEVKTKGKKAAEQLEEYGNDRHRGRHWLGIILLAIGFLALWNQIMPYYVRPEYVWPVGLVVLGLWILLR